MPVFIVPDDDSGRIVTFDVIDAELHEAAAELSDHPVETGVNPTDHVRPLPDRFSCVGYVSNTPIVTNPFTERGTVSSVQLQFPQYTLPPAPTPGFVFRSAVRAVDGALFGQPQATASVLTFADPFDARVEVYEQLLEFLENAVLLQIITTLRTYEDMLIVHLTAPRSVGDAGIAFSLDTRKIRIVESGQVAAPQVSADDVPGGKPLQNKGGQGAKAPGSGEDPKSSGSILFNMAKSKGLL